MKKLLLILPALLILGVPAMAANPDTAEVTLEIEQYMAVTVEDNVAITVSDGGVAGSYTEAVGVSGVANVQVTGAAGIVEDTPADPGDWSCDAAVAFTNAGPGDAIAGSLDVTVDNLTPATATPGSYTATLTVTLSKAP